MSGGLTALATNPVFSTKDFKAVPAKYRTLIPDYIKDYVSLNQFAARGCSPENNLPELKRFGLINASNPPRLCLHA